MKARIIDWEAIHHRLAAATAAISESADPSPEESRRILEARARAAAKPPITPDEAERIEVLAFSLAGETYGVETCHVREVRQLKDLTAVPCTPPFLAGVMNLRGRIIAIIDLRKFFELPTKGLTELNRAIVLTGGDNELGLLADSIDGVRCPTCRTACPRSAAFATGFSRVLPGRCWPCWTVPACLQTLVSRSMKR
jgi:purine-binding chemotaxis protein CheW